MTAGYENTVKTLSGMQDLELVNLARKGDSVAIELIIRRNNQSMYRAARGVLNDDDLAQEVLQDAYLKAFTNLESFKSKASLKTWLTRIVVNRAIDVRRRQRNVVSIDDDLTLFKTGSSTEMGMIDHIIDKSNPEIEIGRLELKSLLDSATGRLPEIYRSVFLLRDIEGYSVSEAAYSLEISESSVKKRLSRARELLRKELLKNIEHGEELIYEFAGKRCDNLTINVMRKLASLGLV